MKDNGQNAVARSQGFSAGLKLWIFFLLGFVFLGIPVPLSILFAAIGGFSGSRVVTWWNSQDEPSPSTSDNESTLPETPIPLNETSPRKRQKYSKNKQRYQSKPRFSLPFRKKSSSSKSQK